MAQKSKPISPLKWAEVIRQLREVKKPKKSTPPIIEYHEQIILKQMEKDYENEEKQSNGKNTSNN